MGIFFTYLNILLLVVSPAVFSLKECRHGRLGSYRHGQNSKMLTINITLQNSSHISATCNLLLRLRNPTMEIKISILEHDRKENLILNKIYRTCDIERQAKRNHFTDLIFSQVIRKYTTIPTKCPLNAGIYYIRAFDIRQISAYLSMFNRDNSILIVHCHFYEQFPLQNFTLIGEYLVNVLLTKDWC